MRTTTALVAAAALLLAAAPAVAKRPSASTPGTRTQPAPTKLWYRLSVTAEGHQGPEGLPPERGETSEHNSRWTADSRTAFLLERDTYTDLRGKAIDGYSFSAGMAGQLLSSDDTTTKLEPGCTPDIRGYRQTAPVPVSGLISGFLPDTGYQARFDADDVLARPGGPPAREYNGVSWANEFKCTSEGGYVYLERLKPPDRPSGAASTQHCGYDSGATNASFEVRGRVRYGRKFSLTAVCEAWWYEYGNENGRIIARRSIVYRATFTPCPKSGRTTQRC
jgi:hypothetical protein